MNDIELVDFGGSMVPFPVSVGMVNEFSGIASRLRKQILASTDFDAVPLRKQLADVDRVIVQLRARLDAMQVELDGADLARVPEGVSRGGTGFYYRTIDGVTSLVCEDCWKLMPQYRHFPSGLISPESDGDEGGNYIKRRRTLIEGKMGDWRPGKAVCVECYQAAFQRVYPGAALAEFDCELINAPRASVPTTLAPYVYVPEPKESGDPSELRVLEPQEA